MQSVNCLFCTHSSLHCFTENLHQDGLSTNRRQSLNIRSILRLRPLTRAASRCPFLTPRVPCFGSVTGRFVTDPEKRLEIVAPDLTGFKVSGGKIGGLSCMCFTFSRVEQRVPRCSTPLMILVVILCMLQHSVPLDISLHVSVATSDARYFASRRTGWPWRLHSNHPDTGVNFNQTLA